MMSDTSEFDSWRWWALGAALALVLSLLFLRGGYLQVVRGADFRLQAEGNRVSLLAEPAPRGIIYDHYGQPLVENVASTDVVVDPTVLPAAEDEGELVNLLAELLALTPDEVAEALLEARERQRSVMVARAVDHEVVLRLQEAAEHLPGVSVRPAMVRRYIYGPVTAHVLGYTSSPQEQDIEDIDGLLATDVVGRTGIEEQYNEVLRGKPAVAYTEIDVAGRPIREVARQEAVAGEDVAIKLDIELQKHIHQIFQEREDDPEIEGPVSGAVIATDPRDGGVVAMVSWPAYDPNIFSLPANRGSVPDILRDEQRPLFHRAADGTYPPGSTIKPFLAAAALEENVISSRTTIFSSGGIQKGPWNFPDWKAGGHGVTDVRKAIAESVNTFFYVVTGGDDTREGLGVKRSTDYLREFGWGTQTGIDLPAEADGFLPSPEWKEEVKDEPWYIGDTYHLGIGQGDVLVSPIQLAVATGAMANGGYVRPPRLVVNPEEGSSHKIGISESHIATVRSGMRQTVLEGSGKRLAPLPVSLAGKTGTAQVGGSDKTHAWFTSFGPFEEPELTVTVLVEKGGAGDEVAVPVAESIWKWWIENRHRQ